MKTEENKPYAQQVEDAALEVIKEWKHTWMNQRQNSEADFQNYFDRAFGVDANMQHSLAKKIADRFTPEWNAARANPITNVGVWDENKIIDEVLRLKEIGYNKRLPVHIARFQFNQQKQISQLSTKELLENEKVRELVEALTKVKNGEGREKITYGPYQYSQIAEKALADWQG